MLSVRYIVREVSVVRAAETRIALPAGMRLTGCAFKIAGTFTEPPVMFSVKAGRAALRGRVRPEVDGAFEAMTPFCADPCAGEAVIQLTQPPSASTPAPVAVKIILKVQK